MYPFGYKANNPPLNERGWLIPFHPTDWPVLIAPGDTLVGFLTND
jgi:hypothetical protein